MFKMEIFSVRTVNRLILPAMIFGVIFSSATLGHDLTDLLAATPPDILYVEEINSLADRFGDGAATIRGVYDNFKLWDTGSAPKGCFYDGSSRIKAFFVQVAQDWLGGTSLSIDFGNAPNYRSCSDPSEAEIQRQFRDQTIVRAGCSLLRSASYRHDFDPVAQS
jgi:hypothetical protein